MKSAETTVAAYLAALEPDRRGPMKELRKLIRAHLPRGFAEQMAYGMIGYVVPLKLYPPGYHAKRGEPLPFLQLASQKSHIALYHMALSEEPLLSWFQVRYLAETGLKPDLGKSCLRLKHLSPLPVETISELCERITPEAWIAQYESSRLRH